MKYAHTHSQTQSNMALHKCYIYGRDMENLIQNTVQLVSSVTLKKKVSEQ